MDQQLAEGWLVAFSDEYGNRIEKFDDNTPFSNDLEAFEFVIRQANSGSQYHIDALAECGVQMEAFALGYYHGKEEGVEQNPYESDAPARHWYRQGYDKGVADYCEEAHQEDCE